MQFYRRWSRPVALSFDLDDTLYDNHPVIKRANVWMEDTLADELGQRINWTIYKNKVLQHDPMLIHDVTECRRAWLSLGLKTQGVAHAKERANELMEAFIAVRSDFSVPERSHQLLAKLAQRYPLVAMTNGNVDIQRIGIAEYFTHIYYAGGEYRQKPYPDLFQATAEALSLPPEQIAHVGDDPHTDVYGALCHGYQSVWLNDRQSPCPVHLPHVSVTDLAELEALLV
ncbi:HAD-IA family hydrolase [Celerinatantimonas diazotrophica]|uniref:Putative hydrolase of the HAD superfamily n=1 Tax=Celerinatantimonas diazotrophica TaxID=412034 RepID=A0A4R1KF15_9GAMM|nr:HAD-IA family hydrolase [Celerinatantimonas diazotrophica]TCK63328.1 putative hydrolase of the HAD superfamily [Celerinatantimonas diazotrophica]CAG9298472.1 5-amino-6-(5-phospho-D-ribitylamino)uracil phosphatase YigB [Celerinatantimonas diazotrophica]